MFHQALSGSRQGMTRNELLDVIDRLDGGLITDFQKLSRAASLVPTDVANSGDDNQVGVCLLLIGNDALNGHEGLCKHAECRSWGLHKPGAVCSNIDRNDDIGAKIAYVTNGKISDQAAVNQQSSFGVAAGDIKRRHAAAGANRKRDITGVP